VGILHAIRMQKLVADARRAHAQGDDTFWGLPRYVDIYELCSQIQAT
jgi:hypothetical protein